MRLAVCWPAGASEAITKFFVTTTVRRLAFDWRWLQIELRRNFSFFFLLGTYLPVQAAKIYFRSDDVLRSLSQLIPERQTIRSDKSFLRDYLSSNPRRKHISHWLMKRSPLHVPLAVDLFVKNLRIRAAKGCAHMLEHWTDFHSWQVFAALNLMNGRAVSKIAFSDICANEARLPSRATLGNCVVSGVCVCVKFFSLRFIGFLSWLRWRQAENCLADNVRSRSTSRSVPIGLWRLGRDIESSEDPEQRERERISRAKPLVSQVTYIHACINHVFQIFGIYTWNCVDQIHQHATYFRIRWFLASLDETDASTVRREATRRSRTITSST